jgi:hypothetical protein
MSERLLFKNRRGISLLLRYRVFMISAVVLVIALFYAHIKITHMGEDYKGAMLLVDRMFDLTLAIGITGVAFCVGRKSARLLSLSFANVAEELSFSIMMGVGIIGLVMLCLGLAGLLAPVPVVLSVALLIILSWREGATLFTVLKEGIVSATSTKLRLILTILFSALVVILALRAMTPPHTPDEAIYHLSVTKLFVEQGRVFPVADNWAGNIPFLIQMIYAICLIAKADIAAKLFSLCLAVVCSLALYGFSQRFLTRRTGVVAMFGFFAAGMVAEVAVTSRIDVSLAGMLFLAVYAMMVYFQTSRRGWLCASAMLSGFSLGIKYSAGIYIFLLGVMFLVESFLRGQDSAITIIKRGILYSAIVAAVASPWFIKNFIWFGNPVYPFVTGEVAELAPGQFRYFTAEDQLKLDAHFDRARREMPELVREREIEMVRAASKRVNRHPLRFWEYFTKPDTYNMAEEFHYPNYLFLFAPLMVFAARTRWLIWLGVFSVVFFLAAINTTWIARMLLPIYPALTLISANTLTELAARADWGGRRQKYSSKLKLLPALAVVVTLGLTVLLSIFQSINTNDLSFIKGDLSRSEYMRGFYYYPPSYFINHSIPERSRVMMIGAQTCYDLQRDYIADVNWDSTEWRRLLVRNNTVEELNEDMKRRGITHVWVAYGLFTFVAEMGRENYPNVSGNALKTGPGYQAQLMNWATLDLYSSKFLEPIYNDRFGNIVYRIK